MSDTNEDMCIHVRMWPTLFITNLSQAVVYMLYLFLIYHKYSIFILDQVRRMVQIYGLGLFMRPAVIALCT